MSKLAGLMRAPRPWPWPVKVAYAVVAGLPIWAVCALIVWSLISIPVRSAVNDHTIAMMRSELRPGMTREECYRWLRRHHLTAVNQAYVHWQRDDNNGWVSVDEGAWPQSGTPRQKPEIDGPILAPPENPLHPEVYIDLNAGWTGGCGGVLTEKLTFDRHDRIDRLTLSKKALWTCL